MPDLLFELGAEELPSWYVSQGREALASGMAAALERARLAHGGIESFSTPRRLAVIVRDLAKASERRSEKRRGPPQQAAFDREGNLTRAALGFAEANGVDAASLVVEETDKGPYLFALREAGGEEAMALLPSLLKDLVENLPAPRKMRWGEVETPFVRPVSWIVALLGDSVVDVEVAGRLSGRRTRGHRFLAPSELELAAPEEYLTQLRSAQVLADQEERRRATWSAVCEAAGGEGLVPQQDEALLDEVTNLVEKPFAILGAFGEAYLELPDELLATVMIHHQRYFPVCGSNGDLAPRFVGVSNNMVPDVSVVRSGYEAVLAGRLYDARFFWDSDRSKSLSQHAWALSGIHFHAKLGTMADKVSRVGETAGRLAQQLGMGGAQERVLESALPIFRADLATGMVYEFPELEGVMARAYSVAEGQPHEVGQALEDGVRPKGPDDSLPRAPAGAVLSVADRVDKLLGFFAVGKRGSGSADPFGLRRDALGLARVLNSAGWTQPPGKLIAAGLPAFDGAGVDATEETAIEVDRFLWDRVASLLAEEGIGVHLIRAATADAPAVITASRRAHLLLALASEPEFPAFMTLYKRAANLAEKAGDDEIDPALFERPEEAPLHQALPLAREGMDELVALGATLEPWDLGRGPRSQLPPLDSAIGKVLQIKEPLDAFLDNVLVMVEEGRLRRNRLALLREVRDALRALGRLEELEGI